MLELVHQGTGQMRRCRNALRESLHQRGLGHDLRSQKQRTKYYWKTPATSLQDLLSSQRFLTGRQKVMLACTTRPVVSADQPIKPEARGLT